MCTFVCGEGCFEYRLNSIGIHKRFKGRKDDPQFDWLSSTTEFTRREAVGMEQLVIYF